MTPDTLLLRKLNNHLRIDLECLDQVMKDYAGFHARFAAEMDRHLYRAVASFMTDFYLCVEGIFVAIAEQLDGGAPRGRNWHRRLLASMAAEVPGVRPAVITPELAAALTEYLVFRHTIPLAYGSHFEQPHLAALQKRFVQTTEMFRQELKAFCDSCDTTRRT